MAKSERVAKISKAGKRSGNQVWPAPISSERRAAKEQGEAQFVAKEQLVVVDEVQVIAFDQKLGRFVYRDKKVHTTVEFKNDPARDRVVYSPSFKEKSSK